MTGLVRGISGMLCRKMICLLYVLILISSIMVLPKFLYATPPDKPSHILREKELTVTLYVISISSESSNLKGVEFLWIPEPIEDQCVGKDYKSCMELYRSQENKLFNKCPSRILSSWVAEKDKFYQ